MEIVGYGWGRGEEGTWWGSWTFEAASDHFFGVNPPPTHTHFILHIFFKTHQLVINQSGGAKVGRKGGGRGKNNSTTHK